MATDREPTTSDLHVDTMTSVCDSVDVRSIKRDPINMMRKPQIDSLGRAPQSFERPRIANGFILPYTAYRLVADFLRCDPNFCNNAIPDFLPFGWVSLFFNTPPQVMTHGKDVKNISENEVRIPMRHE